MLLSDYGILRSQSLTIFQVHVMCLQIEVYRGNMIVGLSEISHGYTLTGHVADDHSTS